MSERKFCPVTKIDNLNLAIGFETIKAEATCTSCGFLYSSDRDGKYENLFVQNYKNVNLPSFQCENCFNENYNITLYGYLAFGKCQKKGNADG